MNGGPSQVDTFDPKPLLAKYHGKPLPGPTLRTERKTGAALGSPFAFKKYGQSGIEVSDLFARTAKRHIDDMCIIRSMYADVPNHEPSLMLMNCGDGRLQRPSMGSWITYGLGSENQNLPGFIAMCPGGYPIVATQNWRSAFLPGAYQGTYIDTRHTEIDKLIENIRNEAATPSEQRRQLDLVRRLNERHAASRAHDPALEARIQSFELAYRMQGEAAEAFDISREPASHPGAIWTGHPGPATLDHPPLARAGRALHPGLERRGPALGRPRKHQDPPPPARRRVGPGHRRFPHRPETVRAVRPGAGGLGRRVRPDTRSRAAGALRPRSQPLRLLHVAGRRRRPRRLRPRRHRRARLRRDPGPRFTSTTSTPRCSIFWASTTKSSPIATPAATSA